MKIYTSDWLVTQNDGREVFANGALAVDGRFVADAGPSAEVLARHPGAQVENLGACVVAPGLVNAHAHVPMSALRGLGDDKPLMAWLSEDIFPREAKWTAAGIKAAARASFREMLATGTTAFFDMYMLEENVFEAADEAGMRGVLGENVTMYFPQLGGADEKSLFDRIRRNAETMRGHPRLKPAVTPHAVYTTTPDLLRRARPGGRTGLRLRHAHGGNPGRNLRLRRRPRNAARPVLRLSGDSRLLDHALPLR